MQKKTYSYYEKKDSLMNIFCRWILDLPFGSDMSRGRLTCLCAWRILYVVYTSTRTNLLKEIWIFRPFSVILSKYYLETLNYILTDCFFICEQVGLGWIFIEIETRLI